jgi:glycosyltransferase involved in cell wall biosynthesis
MKRPDGVTVTLCMIVKDETHIIKECLESMLPYIDRYDITDTGSTDGTPELIKEFMDTHGVPGEVYMSDWKGFGKSRTEALENCQGKANYAWMIDADDKITGNFNYPPEMDADSYSIRLGRPDFSWFRNQIFKVDDPSRKWHYVGVLHEYATMIDIPPEQMRIVKWDAGNYFLEARTLGNRNVGIDPVEKYTRDAETLKSALTNPEDPYYEPTNVRYQFYLAQSYFDSQQWDKSLEAY